MPFVNHHKEKEPSSSPDRQALFIGRSDELRYFSEKILKPLRPDRNIISIYGQGGVGKSTLVQHMINEAAREEFQNYCRTARVNELQTGLTEIMEQLAEQLAITGEFASALTKYKDASRKLQQDYDNSLEKGVRDLSSKFVGDLASKIPVPIVNDIAKQGATNIVNGVFDGWHYQQQLREARRMENPIKDLTQAFVKELNKLAMAEKTLPDKQRRYQRLLLFFDTYEQLASYVGQWLLDQVLTEDIEMDIVFILVGRDPVIRSHTDDPKKWLTYEADCHIISLEPFSEDESNAYLSQRGITDPEQRATIWQLSRGLPLYLSLLTVNPHEKVDPTADVVDNFLRWIAIDEQIKRQLTLDMSLHSRPFSQDDLSTCPYVPIEQQSSLFNWLITQPFIQGYGLNGRYSYHDVVRGLFRRYLYSRFQQQYNEARQRIADHYQQERQKLIASTGEEAKEKAQWQELSLALIEQLLLLPTQEKHTEAIGLVVQAQKQSSRSEIERVLQTISTEQRTVMLQDKPNKIVSILIEYNKNDDANPEDDADPEKEDLHLEQEKKQRIKERRKVLNTLLKYVEEAPSVNTKAQALLYVKRSLLSLRTQNGMADALADIDKALQLDPKQSVLHRARGMILISNKRLYDALEAFNYALSLMSEIDADTYFQIGQILNVRSHNEEALLYFDKALALDEENTNYLLMKSQALLQLKRYEEALTIIENTPTLQKKDLEVFYIIRGQIFSKLKRFAEALKDFDQIIQIGDKQWVAYFLKSQIYQQQQQYQEALEIIEEAWIRYPALIDSKACYHLKGRLLSHLKRHDEALSAFNKVLEMDKDNAEAYTNKGNVLVELQRYDEALPIFNVAIRLDPNNTRAYRGKSFALLSLKRPEEGLEVLEQAICIEPDEALLYLAKGDILLTLKRYTDALNAFEQAIHFDPNNDSAYVGKGKTYIQRKQYNDALNAFEKAIEFNNKNYDAYFDRGVALDQLQRYDEALTTLDHALLLDPANAHAYMLKGAILGQLQRYDEALTTLDHALLLDPTNAYTYTFKGATLYQLQLYDEALIALDHALLLDPAHTDAYMDKGRTLHQLQRYDEALSAFEEGLRLDPAHATAYANKGAILGQLQRYDEALTTLDHALLLDPTHTNAYANKGATLHQLQRYDEALTVLNHALDIDPANAVAYTNKGAALGHLQRYDEALDAYNQAIQLNQDNDSHHYYKGCILLKLKLYEDAVQTFMDHFEPQRNAPLDDKTATFDIKEEYNEALLWIDQAIEKAPENADVYIHKGILLLVFCKWEEALTTFNQAIQLQTDRKNVYIWKGALLLQLERYQDATTLADEMLALDSRDVDALEIKGDALLALEQYQKTIDLLGDAITLDPKRANLYVARGQAYLQLEQYQAAIENLDQALKLDPEHASWRTIRNEASEKFQQKQMALFQAQTAPKRSEHNLFEPLKEKPLLLGKDGVATAVLQTKLSMPTLTSKPAKNLNRNQRRNAGKKPRKH